MPKGHFPRTPEHRANISKANKGLKRSRETCDRISKAKTGRKMPPGFAEKCSLRLKGKPSGRIWNEELSATMTAAKLGKCGRLMRYGISNEEYQKRVQDGEKWCVHNKHFSPKEMFHGRSVCNDCLPEYTREMNLTRLFGVNHEWYLAKLADQDGACAICGTKDRMDSSGKKHFGIDHCHTTGAIRGLLCFRCNSALERLDAIPNWCIYATAYIEKYARSKPYIPIKRKHAGKYIKKPKGGPIAEPQPTVVS